MEEEKIKVLQKPAGKIDTHKSTLTDAERKQNKKQYYKAYFAKIDRNKQRRIASAQRPAAQRAIDNEKARVRQEIKSANKKALRVCSGNERILCSKNDCDNCYKQSFASHPKSIHWSPENKLRPRDYTIKSTIKVKMKCERCPHTFESAICFISAGNWCPYCSNSKLCEESTCTICYEKSFASDKRSVEWGDNNGITPRQIFKRTTTKYNMKCLVCEHEYIKCPSNSGGCTYCSIVGRVLCGNIDCKSCTPRSFHSVEHSKYWSIKNQVRPHQVFRTDETKYIFDCVCGHELMKSPLDIMKNSTGCPYCAKTGRLQLCDNNACDYCFKRSFASVPNSACLHPDEVINPRQTFKTSSEIKYRFICNNKHVFKTTPKQVSAGYWCIRCINKTESKCFEILKKHEPDVQMHVYFDWCTNDVTGRMLPFDFVIEHLKLIIELDGPQHFEQIKHWTPLKESRRRDWLKMRAALANGYSVIRLLQDDVWRDKNDWYGIFMDNFQKYDTPELVFISGEGRYDTFEDMLIETIPDETDADVLDDE